MFEPVSTTLLWGKNVKICIISSKKYQYYILALFLGTIGGRGNLSGGKFLTQKVPILIVFTQNCANFCKFFPNLHKFLQFFPKFVQILIIFTKKGGNFFKNFPHAGKIYFFWQNSHLCPELIFSRIFTYGGSWLSNNFTIFKAFLTVPYGKVSVSIFQLF